MSNQIQEQELRDELYSAISDDHKDLHGFRCRFNPKDYSIAELQEMADDLSRQLREEIEAEEAEERRVAAKVAEAYQAKPVGVNIGQLLEGALA